MRDDAHGDAEAGGRELEEIDLWMRFAKDEVRLFVEVGDYRYREAV
jgi:hypothetical protein